MDSLRFYGHLSVLMVILSWTQALIYLRSGYHLGFLVVAVVVYWNLYTISNICSFLQAIK
jgi:hypothetical protein